MDKFRYSDFFDFDDDSPLSDAIKLVDKFQDTLVNMAKSVSVSIDKVNQEFEDLKGQAAELLKSNDKLNVTYEENQKALNENAKASKALVIQNEKLEKTQAENVKVMNDLNKSVESLEKSKKELAKANNTEANSLNDLKKQLKDATDGYKRLGDSVDNAIKEESLNNIKELSTRFNAANKALNEARKSAANAAGSYNELNQFVLEGRKRLKQMEGGLEGNSKEFKDLQKEVREARDRLAEWDKAIGDNFRNVGNYEDALKGLGDQFTGLLKPIQKPSDLISTFGSSIPIPQVAAFTAATAGLVAVFDDLVDTAGEVNGQMRDVAALTGLANEELEELTSGIRASAAAFDKDFNEVLRATNVLMEEFDLTGTEALAKINQGFVSGADASGELLDQISEYSAQFKAAGLDADNLINIIQTSTDRGIFSDKGADTIKEAGLSLREMTKATSDALQPLGQLRVEQIRAAVESGETFQAIQLVSKGLKEVDLNAQQTQTIIADVFKGAGEDAGLDFILSLETINAGLGDTTKELNKYQKAQLELLEAEQQLADSEVALAEALGGTSKGFKTFGILLKSFAIDTVVAFLDALQPLRDALGTIFDAFGRIVDAFAVFRDEGEESISTTEILSIAFKLLLSPVTLAARLLGFLTEKLAEFIEESPKAQAVIKFLSDQFKLFVLVIENTPALFAGFLNAAVAAFNGLKDLAIGVLGDVKDLIVAAFDPTTDISDVIARSKERFKGFGDTVGDAFKEAFLAQKKSEKEAEEAIEKEAADKAKKTAVKEAAARSKAVTDAEKKEAEKRAKELAAIAKKASEARLKLFRIEQEEIIRINEAFAADFRNDLKNRLEAQEGASQARINILLAEKEAALSNTELLAEERLAIEADYAAQIEAIQRQLSDNLAAIVAENFEREFELDQLGIDTEQLEALEEANEKFRNGEIESLEEFEAEKLRIQEESQLRLLESQLKYLEDKAAQLRENGFDTTEIDRDIAATRLAIAEAQNAELIEKEEKLQDAVNQLKETAFNSALTIIDNLNEAEDEKRERDLEKLDEQEAAELALAGDNEERKAEIQAEFAEKRKAIEEEQANANKRRAIFEKALAATQIAIDTSRAVISAVAASPLTGGLPFSAIVAAIGAVQLAAVLSKPIPQFAEGTDSSPEGLAIVNEEGTELMERGGKMFYYPTKTATMVNLEKGTKVYDADTSEDMLKQAEFHAITNGYNEGAVQITQPVVIEAGLKQEMRNGFEAVSHAVRSQPQAIINIDKTDLNFMTKKGLRTIELFNKKYGLDR